MNEDKIYKELVKGVVTNDNQGYALYFKYNDLEINKTNGVLNVNDNKPKQIDFDSHFRLASVTKQFIACGIIRLVEQGLLTFDTCIKDIFPILPAYFDKIKIINLLNHTSGIYDYEDWEHEDDAPQVLDPEIIDFLLTTDKTYFEIGSKYQYSNTAYVMLANIIEKVSGKKLDEFMINNVFKPAKLFDTYVNYQGITEIPNRAYGHLENKDGSIFMKDQYWCSATIGDGGLYSSINDLKKWIDFYLSNDALFLYDTMFKESVESSKNYYYGMGMRIIHLDNGKKIYYHCGDTIGTDTLVLFSKDLDLKCVFLTNLGNHDTAIIKDNILELIKKL